MAAYTLYFAPDTCALATHIALEHVAADYAAVRIDFAAAEQRSAAFLRINPKGRVPALVTPRGVLTETPALLLYVCQTFPDAGLAPSGDPFALAQLQAFNSYLCSTAHVAHAHRMRGYRWADEPEAIAAMQRKVPQSVAECFDAIERFMFRGPWVMGAQYSVADMYLFTLARFLEGDGVDPERFPKVADHRRRMAADPAVARALRAEGVGT